MQRSISRSKWQDVLGFDDGSSPNAAPVYRYKSAQSLPELPLSPTTLYPHFPRSITFVYHKNQQDILAKQYLPVPQYGPIDEIKRPPKPQTFFYIEINDDPRPDVQTSRPEIILHAGRSQSTRIAAFAKFHSVTESTEITLRPAGEWAKSRPGTSPQESVFSKPSLVLGKDDSERPRFRIVRVERKGNLLKGEKFCFSSYITGFDGSITRERFEWKHRERRMGHGRSEKEGYKLIMISTRQVVAIYEKDETETYGAGILGHFKFIAEEGALGEEAEVIASVSLLSILERKRRNGGIQQLGIFSNRCGLGGFID